MAALGLAAYATSSESESEEDELPSASHRKVVASAGPPQEHAAAVSALNARSAPKRAFDNFGDKIGKRKFSRAGLPLFNAPVREDGSDDSDEEISRKRARASVRRKGTGQALDFLPKPKLDLPVFNARPEPTARKEAPGPSEPGTSNAPVTETSEIYRVVEDPDGGMATTYQAPPVPDQASDALSPEEVLRRSLQAAGQHIELKEVRADTIQAVDPGKKADYDAIRTALGSEYAKELQAATAGKHEPSRMQRQKHQLNALYHHAKVTELQDMERKSVGTKSKAETAAKYGW